MRDEFSEKTKLLLAKRVGFRCSNPKCQKMTSGPSQVPTEAINIGVAAHITAASPNGPRYDSSLTQEERESHENGIWLCQNCAKIIDDDPTFTKEILHGWKSQAESTAQESIQSSDTFHLYTRHSASLVVLCDQIEHLATSMASDIEKQIEIVKKLWREGQREEAVEWVKNQKEDTGKWQVIPPNIKAKVLGFEARLMLSENEGIIQAKRLLSEAKSLDPTFSETRIKALIVYKENGPDAAIKYLEGMTEPESVNLRAALLLESGQIDESLKTLDYEKTGIKPDAETFRVRALSHLLYRNLNQARLEIKKALELEPQWVSIRHTAAIIGYFSSLSIVALTKQIVPWPYPVGWVLVKKDDESLIRLREAACIFKDLIERPSQDKEERQFLETWYLACLANDPEKQKEAIEYCRELLMKDPANFRAISWAIARHYEIDLEICEGALKSFFKEGRAELPHILALYEICNALGKAGESKKLLEDSKVIFNEKGAGLLWTYCYLQSMINTGEAESAIKTIDDSKFANELRQVKVMALRNLSQNTGDLLSVIKYLETCLEDTGDPKYLLDVCELMASQKDWAYVSDRADRLVNEIGTIEALRLAVFSTYNTKRFEECLRFLDEHLNFFQNNKIPPDLRHIRINCLHAIGLLPEAIAEAEDLNREVPSLESQIALSTLFFDKGDLKGLAIVARRILDDSTLTSEKSLWFAQVVQLEDRHLAISFWKKAIEKGIPDELVGNAISTGYQLGLDTELRPLFLRMIELGRVGKGGIRAFSTEEIISFAKERFESTLKLQEKYRTASAPIHVIAHSLNITLADLYHGLLYNNETAPEPNNQGYILVRHGSRAIPLEFSQKYPNPSLYVDITSVLLAAHLEILDDVMRLFAPINIPANLVPALIVMRDKCQYHQPSRLAAFRQIIDLVDKGELLALKTKLPDEYQNDLLVKELGSNLVALFEKAREKNGYVADFLPLKNVDLSGPPSGLPEGAYNHFVNCHSIITALYRQGPLSKKQYQEALDNLAETGKEIDNETIPIESKPLYLSGSIVESLASSGILPIICKRFETYLDKEHLEEIHNEIRKYDQSQRLGEWLNDVIDQIRKLIEQKKINLIPAFSEGENRPEKDMLHQLDINCLLTIFGVKPKEGDIIWVDDRFSNSYLFRDCAPVVGINEILKALLNKGILSKPQYYQKLNKLRASNARFIPLEKDDIIYHLNQARIDNSTVIETNELTILRRYTSACLLKRDFIPGPQMMGKLPNENGEIGFLIVQVRNISSALGEIWENEDDDNICVARSEWVINNLYIDLLGLLTVAGFKKPEHEPLNLAAVNLASLITQAVTLINHSRKSNNTASKRYLDWLYERILRRRFDTEPNLLSAIVEILKNNIRNIHGKIVNDESPQIAAILIQGFYEDLPKCLKVELEKNIEFTSSLGIHLATFANVGNLSFDQDEFLHAAEEAVNGRECSIGAKKPPKQITFMPFTNENDQRVFCFIDPESKSRVVVNNEDLLLLIESTADREKLLLQHKIWFDSGEDDVKRAIATILSIESPKLRLEELSLWRKRSVANFYKDLFQELSKTPQITFSELKPPSADGLLRHFRIVDLIERGVGIEDIFKTAAFKLVQEVGPLGALEQFAGLPIPLPDPVINSFLELATEDKHAIINTFVKTLGSPVSKIHFIKLLLMVGNEKSSYKRLARRLIKYLFSENGKIEFDAFIAILNWVNDEFQNIPEMRSWERGIKLAMVWYHAHRLYTIFISNGAPDSWLKDTFSQANMRISLELFERVPENWLDIIHPRLVDKVNFLISGLYYSLGNCTKDIFDEELRSMFIQNFFIEKEGIRLPVLPLLRDRSRALNYLNSFLGGNSIEKLSRLLAGDDSKLFSNFNYQQLAEEAIGRLSTVKDEFLSWVQLHAVLGDLPPYDAINEQLKAILSSLEFVSIFKKNIDCGHLAFRLASLQSYNLEDESLRVHLKEELIKITKYFSETYRKVEDPLVASRDGIPEQQSIYFTLIEWALDISISLPTVSNVYSEFCSLVLQLWETWPLLESRHNNLIRHLLEILPLPRKENIWPLIVKLRADLS